MTEKQAWYVIERTARSTSPYLRWRSLAGSTAGDNLPSRGALRLSEDRFRLSVSLLSRNLLRRRATRSIRSRGSATCSGLRYLGSIRKRRRPYVLHRRHVP